MFDFLKKKKPHVLGAPAKGKIVALQEVSDPTFGQEILGKGAAVIPAEGRICAPADGVIGMVFDTLHAVSLTTEFGAEVLIHVGLDTVNLRGDGFEGHVKAGDKVKKGDLLLTVDLEKVKAAGYDIITPVVICNTDSFGSVEAKTAASASQGDDMILIQDK